MPVLLPAIFFIFIASNFLGAAKPYDDDLTSIFLRLYHGETINEFTDAPLNEVRNLVILMDRNKPTVFYIHGYAGSVDRGNVIEIVTAYLERKDHNIVAADWRQLAGKNYVSVVVNSVKLAGRILARAVDEMVDHGLPGERIHVIGHSMGAQVAGHLGRQTAFQLSRITGLDPAGPLFCFLQPYLAENDAKFVDIIHTDSGFYGIGRPSGTVNFYPNGGRRVQPGCPTIFQIQSPEDFCSHHLSLVYYVQSLRDEKSFIGTECNNYHAYARGACDQNMKIPMGYATPTNVKGAFYLRTEKKTPFVMQMEGATASKNIIKKKKKKKKKRHNHLYGY